MRITIEPTEEQGVMLNVPYQHKVVVETEHDSLNIDEVMALLAGALKAYGYPDSSVNEWIAPK